MMTTTIQGIYTKGTIKPMTNVDLPNNYLVQIYIKLPLKHQPSKVNYLAESAGILPNLSENYVSKIRKESESKLKQKWYE